MLSNKTVYELEQTVLNYLIYTNVDNISESMDYVLFNEWDDEFKETLRLIKEYAETEKSKRSQGDVLEMLFAQSTNVPALAEIINGVTPDYVGKKAIKILAAKQEEARYKRRLKELLEKDKPLLEAREELKDLIKSPITTLKPKSLMQTAKLRVEERELEAIAPSTGYRDLDQYIKGFIPGHIYVLSGDTNAGKSTMCLNFISRISKQNKTALYFALEPENTVVDYLASIRLKKKFSSLTNDDILHDDPNIHIFGKDQIRKIEDLVKAVQSLPRYDLIVVDHIGYFTSNTANTVSKQSDVMKDLAGLAKERRCAIMLIQHLNKGKTDKSSPENNITGSAAFKQDATDVLILRRDKEEDVYGTTKSLSTGAILIRKSKSDMPQGAVPIRFIDGSALILDSIDQAELF